MYTVVSSEAASRAPSRSAASSTAPKPTLQLLEHQSRDRRLAPSSLASSCGAIVTDRVDLASRSVTPLSLSSRRGRDQGSHQSIARIGQLGGALAFRSDLADSRSDRSELLFQLAGPADSPGTSARPFQGRMLRIRPSRRRPPAAAPCSLSAECTAASRLSASITLIRSTTSAHGRTGATLLARGYASRSPTRSAGKAQDQRRHLDVFRHP